MTVKSRTERLGLIWLQGAEGPTSVPGPETRPELLKKEPRGFLEKTVNWLLGSSTEKTTNENLI